ncbi:MAG TPA: response regulator [Mucilaginibacter sp.]|nr:response regulator [Mucilaginibacter sp.]
MPQKILIVEDDRDILGLLKDLLEDEGYEVCALEHTDSITGNIQQYQPDLVMLDFLLSGINGGELCHEIKANPETAWLPVIMHSAYPRVLDSLGNYGFDAFLAKPFDVEVVLRTIRDCLESRMAQA